MGAIGSENGLQLQTKCYVPGSFALQFFWFPKMRLALDGSAYILTIRSLSSGLFVKPVKKLVGRLVAPDRFVVSFVTNHGSRFTNSRKLP